MRVEAGDLEGHDIRQPQLRRQRPQVALAQAAMAVLDGVQVLDEQVGAPWRIAERRLHLGQGDRIERRPAGPRPALPARRQFPEPVVRHRCRPMPACGEPS